MRMLGVGAMVVFLIAGGAQASAKLVDLKQWAEEEGGNGHWYGVFLNGHLSTGRPEAFIAENLSWTEAFIEATTVGGYLATITSEEENQFVFELSNDDSLWHSGNGLQWGPWLGGTQQPTANPAADWEWVTGEPFTYYSWGDGEPNDFTGPEDSLQYFINNTGARSAVWNDAPRVPRELESPISYVVEFDFDPRPVPEPSGGFWALSITAVFAAGRSCRRLRRNDR